MNANGARPAADSTPQRSAWSRLSAGLLQALRDMLALLAMTGGVWLAHVYGRTLPSAAIAAIWAALTALVAAGLFRRARIRRAAFLTAYIEPGSPLRTLLRGGVIMASHATLLAAALALALLLAVIRLEDGAAWVVLVATVPMLLLVRALARRIFARHTQADYLPELVWRVTSACTGLLMLGALVWVGFHRSYPALGGVGLEQAVFHFVDQEQARSAPILILLKMAAAKDALRLWLAEQLMPRPGTSLLQAVGWLILLAEDSVFVWSYLLLCNGVLMGTRRSGTRRR